MMQLDIFKDALETESLLISDEQMTNRKQQDQQQQSDQNQQPATLVLANGVRIDVTSGEVVSDSLPRAPGGTILSHDRVIKEATQIKRKIADLPEPPDKMHIVALIMVYKLYGLDDNEVAYVLHITPAQVRNVIMSSTYDLLNQAIVESIMEEEGNDIRTLFHENARRAARKMQEFMNSDNESIALTATKDVLDRAGHRPADVVEHRIKREDRLEIVIRKSDDGLSNKDRPIIDINAIKPKLFGSDNEDD